MVYAQQREVDRAVGAVAGAELVEIAGELVELDPEVGGLDDEGFQHEPPRETRTAGARSTLRRDHRGDRRNEDSRQEQRHADGRLLHSGRRPACVLETQVEEIGRASWRE